MPVKIFPDITFTDYRQLMLVSIVNVVFSLREEQLPLTPANLFNSLTIDKNTLFTQTLIRAATREI